VDKQADAKPRSFAKQICKALRVGRGLIWMNDPAKRGSGSPVTSTIFPSETKGLLGFCFLDGRT